MLTQGAPYQGRIKFWLGEGLYQQQKRLLAAVPHKKLIAIAEAELWVREATGNNDGARVEEYLHYVELHRGDPWCAAFVSFVFRQAGYAAPRTGWSPGLFPNRVLVKAAAPGNVFGIYFPALKRIAHCGLITKVRGDWLETLEGNTSKNGGREGDGVYRRTRHKRTIARYANWL